MRCLNCGVFSLSFICKNCKNILLEHTLQKRNINGLNVYSFYNYSEIKTLIHSKHHLHGLFAYKELANLSFKKFAKRYKFDTRVLAVPIDDNIDNGYSHTAILANSLKSKDIAPKFNIIKASSSIKYSGQSLEFRLKNRRNFKLLKSIKNPIILVDDIITTGTTLNEAHEVCKKAKIEVLFALVLANAKENLL
ncbi:putative ComF family competence protein [Campylobacter blaseri]|uniref:Phosphoribosyltransferase n=1 Tax=Campylobacter blaseri TaxID=2042961 RepID=A0A2P8QZ77_9BACT|nr:ComF family protein [Campylobacter blaseri]PSM51549.1 phosphoribosyltransferase [Campylobacter blaseri]PSM53342.1 phosphoribosyltransferase [Campylobacter blaseri]QKF86635.1 putative ComF family competence protein [Campylobacter blaseri]